MTSIEPLEPSALHDALRLTLQSATTAAAPRRAYVSAFAEYLSSGRVTWRGWVTRSAGRINAAVITLRLPGNAMVIMISPPRTMTTTRALLERACEESDSFHATYSQALVESEDLARGAALSACGFSPLTRLHYLERRATPLWRPPELMRSLKWIPFSESLRRRFENCLSETYVDSDDCPEVSRLRSSADSLASHAASGIFNPALWELAQLDGRDVGVLLLAPIPFGGVMEVVYVGVAKEFRRHGLGTALMLRAMERCRDTHHHSLTLGVDCRNISALRLYARLGFEDVGSRTVFLRAGRANAQIADGTLTTCG